MGECDTLLIVCIMGWYAVQQSNKLIACAELTTCTPYWAGYRVLILYLDRTLKAVHRENLARNGTVVTSKVRKV